MKEKPTLLSALKSECVAINMYTELMNKGGIDIREKLRYREILGDEENHKRKLERYVSAPRAWRQNYSISLSGAIQSEKDAISMYSALLSGEGEEKLTAGEEKDVREILTDEVQHLNELEALKEKAKKRKR
jgi:rubrerythrin